MNYGLIEHPTLEANECLVLGLCCDTDFEPAVKTLDNQHNGLINRLFKKLKAAGDTIWQSDMNGHSLMIIDCGKKDEFSPRQLVKRVRDVMAALQKQHIHSATVCLPLVNCFDADWQISQLVRQCDAELYSLNEFKTGESEPISLESLQFYLPGASDQGIKNGEAIAAGIKLTRTLADLPANVCTPTYLSEQALQLGNEFSNLDIKIIEPAEMKQLGMGGLLAISQGSNEEPRFIEIKYQAGNQAQPIILVGKGITFDSGGLSLKPPNLMDEMKYDMAGAATVLGVIKTCALLKLPINLVGLIASAENLPSGTAVKPGDIIRTMSGQTVEILNTDAEGRLVLADALTYAERFNPNIVIDIATLTGAMIIALGHIMTGFMTTDEDLAAKLLSASEKGMDKCWRLPLEEPYQEALDSPIADMINASFDRSAGSITAACFLSRFTKNYRWAHLDIAGTSWVSGKKRHATGRPLPLLIQFLQNIAHAN